MVNVTESAKNELKKIVSSKNVLFFKLLFNGIGWGGPNIGLFESDKDTMEDTVNCNGFNFHVDNRLKEMQPQYGQIVVDFVDDLFGKKFSIKFEKMPPC